MTHASTRHASNAEHLKESAVAVKDAVADLATETGRYASSRAHDVQRSAAAMAQSLKSKAGEYNQSLISVIRKNPYPAIAIAAGIGLVAGFMLRRR